MIPERWAQVRAVLDKVLALDPVARSPYLDVACATDPKLRSEVESILGSYQRAGESGFLQTPAFKLLDSEAEPVPTRVGKRLGAYLILEEIGHGGMGEVYRASRVDGQFEKEVAIKMVRGGFDSGSLLQRFRQERQILASLDHPNIAHLLDGGTSEDGIPYLVMELVIGMPIDQYCDVHGLPISERLGLFRQVCSAVQYAHQRLVIHRDLKPGNILVTSDGTPKLLDFGIAKLLDSSSDAPLTWMGAMTPDYASPEQVRGEPITTASDVYSLGVVLFQLLTGQLPFRMKTRSPSELARVISEVEPLRPSLAASNRSETNIKKGAHADGSLRFRRKLSNDLDNIVLKALRKEPGRRYLSVEQFAEDIRRYLEGRPVRAVPDSVLYRTGKFIRRNKIAVTAAALVAIAIIAGAAASLRQAHIAQQQRRRAEQRFNDVRQLSNSLIFEIHDSIKGLPGATPARKLLLDRAVQYLDKLSQDSSGDTDLQRELAWGYQRLATVQGDTTQSNLGQINAAEESHRKSMALFEAVARANPQNLQDQLNLAMAYRMRAFFDIYTPRGRSEIDKALAVSVPLRKSAADSVELKNELAIEYGILAVIQDESGDRSQAIDTYQKVLDLRQEIQSARPDYPGIRHEVAKATVLLAHEMGRFGSREKAMQLMQEGISQYESLAKETGDAQIIRELSTAGGRRGDVELMIGNMAAARSDFRHSRELIVRLARLDPENTMLQSDLWVADFEEGRALAVSGAYAEALPVLQSSFRGYQNLHLENDVGPGPGAMQEWIGQAQSALGKYADSLKSFESAARTLEEDLGSYDDARCDLAMVQTKRGNSLLRLNRFEEAQTSYAKAIELADVPFSVQHLDTPALYAAAEAYAGMGDLSTKVASRNTTTQNRLQRSEEACTFYKKAVNVMKQIPTSSRYNPNGYLVHTQGFLENRSAQCRSQLRP